MTAKGRIHAIRLSEKIKKNPEYAIKVGVTLDIKELPKNNTNLKKCS